MSTNSQSFCKEATSRVLVVEGKDDCNGIYHLAAKRGFANAFGIWEGGSDREALARFGGLLLASHERPTCLGLVLDCDDSDETAVRAIDRRWAQVKGKLINLGYLLPERPDPLGTVLEAPNGLPRVGFWLMPDNNSEGMFEDFLLRLVPQEAVIFAREVSLTAKARELGNFKDAHLAKATVHTFLAWQDEPGRPFGTALKAGMLDSQSSFADAFVAWLRKLYELP